LNAAACRALARRLGCEIEVHKPMVGKLVKIHLPKGMQVTGKPGLDVLSHNTESDDNIWDYVYDDLVMLVYGMEPLEEG